LVSSWMELNRSVWHSWVAEQKIQKAEAEVSKQLANGLKTIIGKAKQKCLSAYQIKAQPNSLLSVIKELYDRYELKLAEQQRIDYDDMAVKAVKLLEENSYIRSVAQSWFDYLLEDEAQDSSPLQARMLEILSERSGNLVRAGDPNQCIMSTFTNSEPAIFRDFCDKHQRHTLNQSSRSSAKIIKLANHLVDWTNNKHPLLELRSALKTQHIQTAEQNPSDRLSEIEFIKVDGTIQDELKEIVDRACNAIATRKKHSVAILVTKNETGNDILELLKQNGIQANDLLRNNRSAKQLINKICKITKFLGAPTQISTFLEALEAVLPDFCIGISQTQINLIKQQLREYYPEQLLYPTATFPEVRGIEIETEIQITKLLKLFTFWLEQSNLPWDELLRLIVQYLQQCPDDLYMGNYLISQLENEFRDQLLVDWSDISYRIGEILERPLSNLPAEIQNYEPQPGVITVLTCHRSKGLEWDEVFVTDCSAYQFPVHYEEQREKKLNLEPEILSQWQNFILDSPQEPDFNLAVFREKAAEHLRLLYVAITRAKKRLTLSVATMWYDKEQRSSLLFDQLWEFSRTHGLRQSS
ncbi:MAG: ATP-dependent helicase, partial [Cyanobacteria bacterium KgW148]|nr:ATP-dependent helicase [Cyanobacteria bacterium KgW148]